MQGTRLILSLGLDELKAAEGLISKLQRRVRNTVKEAQELVPEGIEVVELSSGESIDLL